MPAKKPRKEASAASKTTRTSRPAKKRPAGKTSQRAATTQAAKKSRARQPKSAVKSAVKPAPQPERAAVLSSQVVFEGPLFRVFRDKIVEPTGLETVRDVVRHNGSVVILAVDKSDKKKDPWIVMERQYRHAANQFLWEIPAGKIELGEDPLAGAKRELAEETGYQARKWSPLVTYYASPGFVGEAMLLYLAEGLYVAGTGDHQPDEDERIELRLVRLSEILKMIEKGEIHDGKTLNAVLLYAWLHGRKRKK